MLTSGKRYSWRAIGLIACGALLLCLAEGQATGGRPDKAETTVNKDEISAAMDKVRQDDIESLIYVDQLVNARAAAQAVPVLEGKFTRSQDTFIKSRTAAALVRLGDKDNTYWDYLASEAEAAIGSDAPDTMNFGPQGNNASEPSSAFFAWATAHNLPFDKAAEEVTFLLPLKIVILAETGDSRGIPLLRRALSSPNHMIEITGASGLAKLRDKDSIPLIIDACDKAPTEAASEIAMMSLLLFDDPRAQSAAEKYIPAERLKAMRAERRLTGGDSHNTQP